MGRKWRARRRRSETVLVFAAFLPPATSTARPITVTEVLPPLARASSPSCALRLTHLGFGAADLGQELPIHAGGAALPKPDQNAITGPVTAPAARVSRGGPFHTLPHARDTSMTDVSRRSRR